MVRSEKVHVQWPRKSVRETSFGSRWTLLRGDLYSTKAGSRHFEKINACGGNIMSDENITTMLILSLTRTASKWIQEYGKNIKRVHGRH